MKALMSETLREIISDPKKNEELKKGVSELQSKTPHVKAIVNIGNQKYEVRFVHRNAKK